MGVRFGLARAVAAVSTWGLRHVFRRPAANFPGKVALYVDPSLVRDLAPRVDASICVVGTNGKTTVTNLLADALEAAGARVVCNRTGANLDSGVTTALLHGRGDWGVFECDELWLAKVLPGLQSRFVLLLNLFRDQLDRVGEIDHIQESIAGALAKSPGTVLIYNADDPLCQAIADRVENPRVPFGLEGDLGLPANTVADARMCQRCSTMLEYDWRHYGQLGAFRCPTCGFARVEPAFLGKVREKGRLELSCAAGLRDAVINSAGPTPSAGTRSSTSARPGKTDALERVPTEEALRTRHHARHETPCQASCLNSSLEYGVSAYMAYNLLAVWAAAALAGVPFEAVERAAAEFDPHNGRLERYSIGGCDVLLNLAKNPTGFNQNLNIVLDGAADTGNSAVAFYINDKEADGHDVSWLWDIDFQNLAGAVAAGDLRVFAGGIRRNDMQVRLKYAGVPAELVDGADDFLARIPEGGNGYVIANYTALPAVKATLDQLQDDPVGTPFKASAERSEAIAAGGRPSDADALKGVPTERGSLGGAYPKDTSPVEAGQLESCGTLRSSVRSLTIAHLFPTLLNLYGDNGNVAVLVERARRRGIDVRVIEVDAGNRRELDWSAVDLVFLGGGPDREQRLAAEFLAEMTDDLRTFVESDGVLLAICGGFQIIGREWLMGEETVPGLGLIGMTTQRAEGGSHNRLVGNIALESPLAPTMPVVGYENHAGRTFLDEGVAPFGQVKGSHGHGNNNRDHADGALWRNVVGTYLHGPLLAKNPEVADELLRRALSRRADVPVEPPPLDDSEEREANLYMRSRLGL